MSFFKRIGLKKSAVLDEEEEEEEELDEDELSILSDSSSLLEDNQLPAVIPQISISLPLHNYIKVT